MLNGARFNRSAFLGCVLLAFWLAGTAIGDAFIAPVTKTPEELIDPNDPYQAAAIVTGYDMRSRPMGFARCLREVLVKLSGEPRLEKDQRITELGVHADALVASFDYADLMAGIPVHDDQGTYDRPYDLVVRFDHAKIDKALADLGEKPWPGPRPLIVPLIAVNRFGHAYLLTGENPAAADQRGSLATAAAQYGMALRVPSEAEFERYGVALGAFPNPSGGASDDAIVAGTLDFVEARGGWVGSWRMRWHGSDYAWGVSGVNFDEAFRTIVRGAMRVASGHGAPD